MWKIFYELLVDPLELPINPIWEYIIIFMIGEIAHEIAFYCSPGGKFGSIIYWVTKLITFVVVWGILYLIISSIQFILSHWVWFILGGVLLIVIIIFIKNKNNW